MMRKYCFLVVIFAQSIDTMTLIQELRWRGMIQDIMPGTEELLQKEQVSGYIGFDPTSDSLHIGSLVPILLLVHLQKAGHKPFALVGGATGMVGDPSGKSEERNLLSEETLAFNIAGVKKQLSHFLDFDSTHSNAAELVNNYDWFKQFTFLDFIREVGKHITVNYMMAKDSVKKRLEGDTGMSFTEFTYQLVQGYDFYWLYKNKNCKLQMGGSDQWGNITTGTELIRRMEGGEAFAITAPLITKSDGTKFGKSEGGNVWLDPNRTSPFKFYQFWLNVADDDAIKFIKIYSLKSREEIQQLIDNHIGNEYQRSLQKALAEELTIRVHSQSDLDMAIKATDIFFGNGSKADLLLLDESTLSASLEGMEKYSISVKELENGVGVLDLLASSTQIFASKGEARKMLQANGFSINKEKFTDVNAIVNKDNLLHNKFIVAQKGKKQYYVIEVI